MKLGRSERSVLGEWWLTTDWLMLSAVLLMMASGLVISLAASPDVAERIGVHHLFFVKRQLAILAPAVLLLFVFSMMSERVLRRVALLLYLTSVGLMVAVLFYGIEIKGARRWIHVGSFSLQPSELVKPFLIILCAWFFSEAQKRSDIPALWLAMLFYGGVVVLLVLQPDFGQTFLITAVWGSLFFLAGLPVVLVAGFAGLAVIGLWGGYTFAPHVKKRIDAFLDPAGSDTYQTDRAMDSILNGSWLGKGPGEGVVKHVLPDAHADFVFAVFVEEYGIILSLALMALMAVICLRGLAFAIFEPDKFRRLAVAGLIMLFGFQTMINLSVNVGLLPAKGMTLPFISYGGSSLLSMAMTMGAVMSLMRRRPGQRNKARILTRSG